MRKNGEHRAFSELPEWMKRDAVPWQDPYLLQRALSLKKLFLKGLMIANNSRRNNGKNYLHKSPLFPTLSLGLPVQMLKRSIATTSCKRPFSPCNEPFLLFPSVPTICSLTAINSPRSIFRKKHSWQEMPDRSPLPRPRSSPK